MRNFLAIAGKELHLLFLSPIAYIVLAVFLAITGWFFFLILNAYVGQGMMQAQMGGMDLPGMIMRAFFGILSTIILFLLPMITMSFFAEEKKTRTIELLLTSPIKTSQLVLGKFAAGLAFLIVMLVPAILYAAILIFYSDPAPALTPYLIGFLGALLLSGSLLAIGIFISSLTENQIVAAAVTFGIFIVLWVLDASAGPSTTATNEILRYLSVLNHYEDFTRGILDTQHLIFYASFIFLGLFLTALSLDSPRWRK